MNWYLLPFSILYRLIINLRNQLYNWGIKKSTSFNFPIISIGNITVGGTGKTPHTEFLINWLSSNYKVATLSRGYKRKTKGYKEVEIESKVQDVGDEPLQIKRKFKHVKVVVDEKRVHGVQTLLNESEKPEIILLDDAYQHRKIKTGLNILLIDYHRPISTDHMLPVGRLREPVHNKNRANIILLTKCPPNLKAIDFRIMLKDLNIFPYQSLFFTCFDYGELTPVFDGTEPISNINGTEVLAVSGIANPKLFYKKIKELGANLSKLQFTDHHNFSKSDINKIIDQYNKQKGEKSIIICTEKDAIRLKDLNINSKLRELPIYYLPITVRFLNNSEQNFKATISKYLSYFYTKK